MDLFLCAINEIMHADLVSKHPVEIEQVNKILRVVPKQGEQCRDVLRYISNLRKQFHDSLAALELLYGHTENKFASLKDWQVEHNNILSNEIQRTQKLKECL